MEKRKLSRKEVIFWSVVNLWLLFVPFLCFAIYDHCNISKHYNFQSLWKTSAPVSEEVQAPNPERPLQVLEKVNELYKKNSERGER